MNRICKMLCAGLLAVLLAVFLISLVDKDASYSETEQRQLAERPKLTFSGFLDGSWWEDLQLYYADTFPGREALLDDLAGMEKFYQFGEK